MCPFIFNLNLVTLQVHYFQELIKYNYLKNSLFSEIKTDDFINILFSEINDFYVSEYLL